MPDPKVDCADPDVSVWEPAHLATHCRYCKHDSDECEWARWMRSPDCAVCVLA
jgi:hypothetical protein